MIDRAALVADEPLLNVEALRLEECLQRPEDGGQEERQDGYAGGNVEGLVGERPENLSALSVCHTGPSAPGTRPEASAPLDAVTRPPRGRAGTASFRAITIRILGLLAR